MSEKYIDIARDENIAILMLSKGLPNAIDLALIEQLSQEINTIRTDPEIRGLVLASSNDKFFSIGFDIPHLFDLPRSQFEDFYHAFNLLCIDLYRLPKPTVAALSGHAIAGGCILALCCDVRFIATGHKLMGLNEVKLGVPVPFVAECILRQLIRGREAREVLESGEFYAPDELLRIGMVDEIKPLPYVLPGAIEKARLMASPPPGAYAAVKSSRVTRVEMQISAGLAQSEQRFIDHWYSPEARPLLEQAMAKFY